MQSKYIFLALGFLTFGILTSGSGCSKETEEPRSVAETLGWDLENLNVSTFRNGDAIPEAKSSEEWFAAGRNETAAWCYYEYDAANGKKYGKLYNWYAVNDARGLAPEGYHVATKQEWNELISVLGGNIEAARKLKSEEYWEENAKGTNESGFFGHPGGFCDAVGKFYLIGEYAGWWVASVDETGPVWYSGLYSDANEEVESGIGGREEGLSVRCVRD